MGKLLTTHYDSYHALVEHVLGDHDTPRKSSEDTKPSPSWDLDTGWRGAVELAQYGWPEGEAEIQAHEGEGDFAGLSEVDRPHFVRRRTGVRVDTAALFSGRPECMLYRASRKVPASVFRLCVQVGYNCTVTAAEAIRYGVAVLAVIDYVESLGRPLEVVAYTSVAVDRGHHHVCQWVAKRPGYGLSRGELLYQLVHPAFFRRLLFREIEVSKHDPVRSTAEYNYGRSNPYIAESECPLGQQVREALIGEYGGAYLPGLRKAAYSVRQHIEACVRSLVEQGALGGGR